MSTAVKGPVLVTGGAGYIGGQTVLALLDAGVEVCVVDDLSTGTLRPFHTDVAFYEGAIHDRRLLDAVFSKHDITAILHFAGSIKVDESVTNPLKYYHNNTEGSRVLIDAAVHHDISNFIFSSTAAVYGITGDEPVSEMAVPHPLNPYGWSKLFTEQQLRDACSVSAMNYGIFRYFNVAGADPELRHGQFLEKPTHLIGRAIDALLDRAPALQVFGNDLPTPDGTGVRDYIHVYDVATAHLALLASMQSSGQSRLLNLGYGVGSSVLEVISAISAEAGKPVPYEFGTLRAGEAPSVVADISSLQESLDWVPKYNNLSQMTASAYNWAKLPKE